MLSSPDTYERTTPMLHNYINASKIIKYYNELLSLVISSEQNSFVSSFLKQSLDIHKLFLFGESYIHKLCAHGVNV